jgi:hypothetical protein
MEIVTNKNSTVGNTETGRPYHCTFMRQSGEINIHFTGRIKIKMENDNSYIETTVEDLETLIAKHKENKKR